jgi:hypothetical protein
MHACACLCRTCVYVCIRVHVYVCMCVSEYKCMYGCVHAYVCMCTCVCMYVCVHVYVCMLVFVCMCICVSVYLCICVYVHVCILCMIFSTNERESLSGYASALYLCCISFLRNWLFFACSKSCSHCLQEQFVATDSAEESPTPNPFRSLRSIFCK